MADSGFKFNIDGNKKINMRLQDEIYDTTPNVGTMMSMLKDLTFTDISGDQEIEKSSDSQHLHKISQYTMQFLLNSIEGLHNQNCLGKDQLKILQSNRVERVKTVEMQKEKLERLNQKIFDMESQNEHTKYVVQQEKLGAGEGKNNVNSQIDRIKAEIDTENVKKGRVGGGSSSRYAKHSATSYPPEQKFNENSDSNFSVVAPVDAHGDRARPSTGKGAQQARKTPTEDYQRPPSNDRPKTTSIVQNPKPPANYDSAIRDDGPAKKSDSLIPKTKVPIGGMKDALQDYDDDWGDE